MLLCAWATWNSPYYAAWFAWGAFFAFVISGAVDEVVAHGISSGLGNLMATYYITAFVHAILASVIWFLSRNMGAWAHG